MVTLTCTICGQPSFAKLRIEITLGAATYLICPNPVCINEASRRANDNLHRAVRKLKASQNVIDVPPPDC